jgi:NADH:ubiquinone oxidoreductase subunit 2 (subunit N)
LGSTSFDIIGAISSEEPIKINLTFFGIVLFLIAIFFKVGAAPSHM